jgi:hypothetical protein
MMVALLFRLLEEPVTVTVKVPIVAVPVADRVKALVVVAGFDPKEALTPLGSPDAVKLTLPLNPLSGWIVIAVEPDAPWRKLTLVGNVERVKPG